MRTYRRHPLLLCERKRNEWFRWDFLSWMSGMNLFLFSFFSFLFFCIKRILIIFLGGGAGEQNSTLQQVFCHDRVNSCSVVNTWSVCASLNSFHCSPSASPQSPRTRLRSRGEAYTWSRWPSILTYRPSYLKKNAKPKIRKLDFEWILIIMINDINHHHHHHHHHHYY